MFLSPLVAVIITPTVFCVELVEVLVVSVIFAFIFVMCVWIKKENMLFDRRVFSNYMAVNAFVRVLVCVCDFNETYLSVG